MRAERLTGYFWTSASKRAASAGEKTNTGSGVVFLGLISLAPVRLQHQLPRPLFGCQVHGLFIGCAAQGSGFGAFHGSHGSIFSRPGKDCVIAVEAQPFFIVADGDFFLGQLNSGLAFRVKTMRRGVAAEQGSKRGPELCPECFQRMSRRGGQRSISPKTISMEPTTATRSAIRRPLHMVSIACRVANEG